MTKLNMVLVYWQDSNMMHGWRDDCSKDKLANCQTVGILKVDDEDKLVLAMSESDENSFLETITIPKGCIKSVKQLRVR